MEVCKINNGSSLGAHFPLEGSVMLSRREKSLYMWLERFRLDSYVALLGLLQEGGETVLVSFIHPEGDSCPRCQEEQCPESTPANFTGLVIPLKKGTFYLAYNNNLSCTISGRMGRRMVRQLAC